MNEEVFVVYAGTVIRICALILLGIPLMRWCSFMMIALCKQRFSQHVGAIIGNVILYGGLLFIIVTVLNELGFNVTALLGAAGVFGVAIGFASQTSVSNIISGFFLLMERPFSIGDTIKSGDVIGVVEAVDLLSVRVRTLDNKMIRLPNETVLKHALINQTYYPIKRIDLIVSVAYSSDAALMIATIHDVIKNNQLFLVNPAPVVMIHKIDQPELSDETRLFFMVKVWVSTAHFTMSPAVLMHQLKVEFDKGNSVVTIIHVN